MTCKKNIVFTQTTCIYSSLSAMNSIHRNQKTNAFVTSSITRFHTARRCGLSFSFSGISFKNNSPIWARIYNQPHNIYSYIILLHGQRLFNVKCVHNILMYYKYIQCIFDSKRSEECIGLTTLFFPPCPRTTFLQHRATIFKRILSERILNLFSVRTIVADRWRLIRK